MPFASDKQRRYLWSQKPEVAKKFAEHKAEGGYTEDGIATHYRNGKPKSQGQIDYERRVKKTNAQLAEDPLLQTAIGLSPLALPLAIDKGIETGEWGDAAIEGAGALAGPLAGGAIKLGKNALKVAPEIGALIKHGYDPDYMSLVGRGLAGKPDLPAKSVGASANIGTDPAIYKATKHPKAGEYTKRLGLEDTEEARKAASDILADATAIRAGKRVDDPSISEGVTKWFEGVNPAGKAAPNYRAAEFPGAPEFLPNNPQDLVDYALPTKAKWKELYPNTPYPTKKPGVLTSKERDILFTGKKNPKAGQDAPFGFAEGHYKTGPIGAKGHRTGPRVDSIAKNVGPIAAPAATKPAINPALARWLDGDKIKPDAPAGLASILRQQGYN